MQNLLTSFTPMRGIIQGTSRIDGFNCSVGRGHTLAPSIMYERVYIVALHPMLFAMGYDRL
jgi:hypothetical protein